jgi:hypothetical protein
MPKSLKELALAILGAIAVISICSVIYAGLYSIYLIETGVF